MDISSQITELVSKITGFLSDFFSGVAGVGMFISSIDPTNPAHVIAGFFMSMILIIIFIKVVMPLLLLLFNLLQAVTIIPQTLKMVLAIPKGILSLIISLFKSKTDTEDAEEEANIEVLEVKDSQELTDEQKHFISVIYGEAADADNDLIRTYKAVAYTIINRYRERGDCWHEVKLVSDVLIKKQYNAVGGRLYSESMDYLNNRDGSKEKYESLIKAVLPIYLEKDINEGYSDFTGGAHYIFNITEKGGKLFEESLIRQPENYIKCGPFDGINDEKFRMYRCLSVILSI